MPASRLTQLRSLQRDLSHRAAERATLIRRIAAHNAELQAAKEEIARQVSLGDTARAEELRAEQERIAAARRQRVAQLAQLDDEVRDALGRGIFRLDSGDADPAVPLLLLPVRLETRFSDDGTALRVRIYPDDVHIDALDRGLTEDERAAGKAYWTAVWRATEEEAGTAWRTLVTAAGKLRAQWVALALRPTNLERRMTEPAPEFSEISPRNRHAAVARLLPDAFTAVVVQGDERRTQTGHAILPQVTVGIFSNDGTELSEVQGIKVVKGAEWLVDYEEAVRVGMAVTVPLARPNEKVDRLLVYGIRHSLNPTSAPAELASLFEAHRCTDGLAFVPQGTPTNNTESDRAGWQRRTDPRPLPRDPGVAPNEHANSAVLAAALGLDAQALADLDYSDAPEQARATAMNISLWNPSWGGFLDKVNRVTKEGAALSDSAREETRIFHRDFVRGRGPLPALRIGSQPYGILPVSSVERRWKTERGDSFEAALLLILERLRRRWRQCLEKVPRIGSGPIDDALKELLASSPVSFALRVRSVISSGFAQIAPEITDVDPDDLAVERLINELVFEEISNASLEYPTGSLGESRPLALPLVDESDPAVIDAILNGQSPGAKSVLQALLELALNRAQKEVESNGAGGRIAEIVSHASTLSAADREQTLAVASRAETAAPSILFAEAKRVGALMDSAPPTLVEYQPVPAASRSFGEMALQSTNADARAELSLFGTHSWLNAHARLNELRDALTELKATDLEERRILVAETLDLASHRLDAWLTAIVERRRRQLRAARPAGLTIAGYGWLQEIEPTGHRQLAGGFVHAPSLTHAATAGILRSAYLSHNGEPNDKGAFAVDLSSARVRTALHLLDGVRQGQPLGGLLGYRIERGLHEEGLDRLVLSLRALAPFSHGKLTDRGEAVAPESVEALAASNVVDGIALVEKYQADPNSIRSALGNKPKDNPYLTGPWPNPIPPNEWSKAAAIIEEAAAALDAVSDLLLAESVHQLVLGNTARAAAALDAASGGDSPAPEPEVIATPAEGMPFTHRIMLVAGEAAPWNLTRPRSAAEPRLEAWAAARLGSAETIIVADAPNDEFFTIADTGFCALDLIYDATDRATFDDRLRAALPGLQPKAKLYETRGADWNEKLRAIGDIFECAASLRVLFVHARPATPADLAVPSVPASRAVSAAGLQEAHDRVQAARDLLGLRCTFLDSLLKAEVHDDAQLRPALEALAAFGLVAPLVHKNQLAFVAQAALAAGQRRLENADVALARPLEAEAIWQAGQAVFGEGFWILPAIDPPAGADSWGAALVAPPPGATTTAVRTCLTDVAAVREGAGRFLEATLLTEATGGAPAWQVAQVTGIGGTAPSGWIGAALPLDEPTPTVALVSTVLEVAGPYDAESATVALVVDEWVDAVPIRARRGQGADAPIDQRLTSGVTFNAMAPSARAPQAMLLAISPDGERWTGEALIETLEETLDLAALRLVTLERTNGIAALLPALYESSWSLQGEKVFHLPDSVLATPALSAIAYVREE
jgi:hypothetical protein